MGFVRLFGVVGQVLVKPHLMRDVNEEYHVFHLEEATVRRKLANTGEYTIIFYFKREFFYKLICSNL